MSGREWNLPVPFAHADDFCVTDSLIRNSDVHQGRLPQNILVEVRERFMDAVVPSPREFDKRRHLLVIGRIARELLAVLEADALDVEVPDELVLEPVFLVGPLPRFAMFREDVVRLESLPHIDEIVEFLKIADMILLNSMARIGFLQEIDDLRFAGRGTSGDDEDRKTVVVHGMPFPGDYLISLILFSFFESMTFSSRTFFSIVSKTVC